MEAEKQRLVAQKFEQKARTGDVMIQEKTTFSGLMLAPEVLEGLEGAGFKVPSPIQLQAIPLGRAGLDLIVQAKSGTGKTCVFAVIALESINTENSCMQVVVLAPTREIAVQIWEVIRSIGRAMEKLRCYAFIGGLNINDDKIKLKKCHIAVATPGRFRQLVELDAANVNSVRLFVLDEADKLLEAGFQDDINWIYSALPTSKQMIAASATYPEYLAQQLTTYMRSPKMVRLNACDPALLGISQYYVLLPFSSQPYKVYEEKSEFLLRLLSSVDFQQCLVFSNYQSRAQSLSKLLDSKGWPSTFICGSQEQEKRLTAMAKLRQYQCRVLISTDLTSRGIDVENVNLVVNLDLPTDHETYLHRIGRAGRYGSFGAAVTLVTQGRESADLRIIETRCQTVIRLLPDPIPEDLTHSGPEVDPNVEVTVEEVVQLDPLMPDPDQQAKKHEETEIPGLKEHEETETPGLKKYEETETPGLKKYEETETPGVKNHEEIETTGQKKYEEIEIPGPREHEETETPGFKNHEDTETPGLKNHEETETLGLKNHEETVMSDLGQKTKKREDAEECIPAHVGRTSEFDALELWRVEAGAACENGIISLKTNHIGRNTKDGVVDIPEDSVKTIVNELPNAAAILGNEIQSRGSDRLGELVSASRGYVSEEDVGAEACGSGPKWVAKDIAFPTDEIHSRESDRVHLDLSMCSFIKGTLPLSDEVFSLGELVSASRGYVSEKDVGAEACGSGPKWVTEDITFPTDESVIDDVGRLIAKSDYDYATQFPSSARLLGDLLETNEGAFPTPDERRVILSAGDAVLRGSVAQPLMNVEVVLDRSGGDAFPQNQMGESNVGLQTLVPKDVGVSTVATPQEAQISGRVKWKREQLMGMERLSRDIIIAPHVARLVQELYINRGCEHAEPRDSWEGSRRENAGGRRGTKFGGRRSNNASNWKEQSKEADVCSSGNPETVRSSYVLPSLPPRESADAGRTALHSFPAEIPADAIVSSPACKERACITDTMRAVSKNQDISNGTDGKFSELPCGGTESLLLGPLRECVPTIGNSTGTICESQDMPQGSDGKFSELPYDSSVSPHPLSMPHTECIQVIGDSAGGIFKNQEIPWHQGNTGKLSELPYDISARGHPPSQPLPECVQVVDNATDANSKTQNVPLQIIRQENDVRLSALEPLSKRIQVIGNDDENQSLGRDYMLKLSACRDVFESSSDASEDVVTESDFHDDYGGLHWKKPTAQQNHRKNCGEKKTQTNARTMDPPRQSLQRNEHRQKSCRTTKIPSTASRERDIPSVREAHNGHRPRDNFMRRGQTGHESYPDKLPHGRGSANFVGHAVPEESSCRGYADLDAYSSYYWNSYLAHLHEAEHFQQLLTSLADQTRLQDIAVQQGAYIQHMIALHRMP